MIAVSTYKKVITILLCMYINMASKYIWQNTTEYKEK